MATLILFTFDHLESIQHEPDTHTKENTRVNRNSDPKYLKLRHQRH